MSEIVITSALRTAIGSLNKSLKNIPSDELGSFIISNSISDSKLKKEDIDEVIMGQVITGGSGQNPARQAAVKAGIPKEKPAYVVNQVCGSGIRSIVSGFQSIKSNDIKNCNCRRARKYVFGSSCNSFKRWKKVRGRRIN